MHGSTESGSIIGSSGQMVGDSGGVVKAEHFKAHGGTASGGDEATKHFGLQQVMVGVVVSLAEKEKISASQTADKTPTIYESGRGDVPDTPGERMILTQGRFPRRDRAPR
jgi:hypothetical protein